MKSNRIAKGISHVARSPRLVTPENDATLIFRFGKKRGKSDTTVPALLGQFPEQRQRRLIKLLVKIQNHNEDEKNKMGFVESWFGLMKIGETKRIIKRVSMTYRDAAAKNKLLEGTGFVWARCSIDTPIGKL